MRTLTLADRPGERAFAVVLDVDEDPLVELRRFADEVGLDGAHVSGLGAFREAVIAWWDGDTKAYVDHPVREQVECAALVGNVARAPDGGRKVHAHVVLGRADGAALAGHLQSARVRPTLELAVREAPGLEREVDPTTGLALLRPGAAAPQ